MIIDGGVDKTQHPSWIEGPHLYHINGTYYLMAAEGGTGPNHSEVIFTSASPFGPFKPCAINPILTQRGCRATVPTRLPASVMPIWWKLPMATGMLSSLVSAPTATVTT